MKRDIKIAFYNKLKNGQIKCKQCGATDINFNKKTGLLKCNYCRYEFSEKIINEDIDDISNLEGVVIGANSRDISENESSVVTFKCQGCGAEISIDTNDTVQARCHWCRSYLSINSQVTKGSIPDVVLPFKTSKKEAEARIKEFVKDRSFFANSKFKKEFNLDNIIGVYFPYTLVDINAHAKFSGNGEELIRKYTVGDSKTTVYDAKLYRVEREFNILIDDLAVESNSDNIDINSETKTNNIINSILPFDTENCVAWNANYLKGYSAEKRNVNINNLKPIVDLQTKDIARISLNKFIEKYDRGVRWEKEDIINNGERWKTAYLPVWLYSYQQVKRKKKVLHYVAVNARTNETMGSVPISVTKLLLMSFFVELLSVLFLLVCDFEHERFGLLLGVVFYLIMYSRYRNADERHKYEKETKNKILNIKNTDEFIEEKIRLSNKYIKGINNRVVKGNKNQIIFIDEINAQIEKFKK